MRRLDPRWIDPSPELVNGIAVCGLLIADCWHGRWIPVPRFREDRLHGNDWGGLR